MVYVVGQPLGNYRVVRLLGQGGFAEVYLGEHVRLGMKAAIKVLHTHISGEAVDAFQHEAQVIADLTHPNIVRVHDFDLQDGRPFLVLDYAPNGSLRERHPRGTRVPAAQVISYVKQVASALQFAHERKLVHRDVKPENILMGEDGHVLLSDFGIATVAHATSSMNTEATMGTLAYMAPEQIQGKPRPASDQYALAVAVYQWLSGVMPFQGSSTEIIAQHLAVMPPPLREKIPAIPPGVERVVMKALSKDPRERFTSVQAFAQALEQAVIADQPASDHARPAINTPSTSNKTISARQSVPRPAPRVDSVRRTSQSTTEKVAGRVRSQLRNIPVFGSIRWITTILVISLIVVVIISAIVHASSPGPVKATGNVLSPYPLSASNTGSQIIGITLAVSSSSLSSGACPTPTVDSLLISRGRTQINISWQALDPVQGYHWTDPSNFSNSDQGQSYQPTSTSSLYTLEYAASPQAGQQWYLNLSIGSNPDQTQQSNYCAYDKLYLQF